jgi:hypothetical protein
VTFLVRALIKLGILKNDLDYHLLRASMVIIFLFFGYQKWFDYEAQALLPCISHGPLIFWMYAVFGVRGATYFLGVAEWLSGDWGFSELLAHVSHSSRPRRSFRLCRTVGPLPPAPFRCVCLFTAAGRDKGFAVQDGGIRLKHHSSAGCKSDRSSRRPLVLPFIPSNERLRETCLHRFGKALQPLYPVALGPG